MAYRRIGQESLNITPWSRSASSLDQLDALIDNAHRGSHFGDAVRAKSGTPRVAATAMWEQDEQETLARLDAYNAPMHRVRARIEKIFGTCKRGSGLRRMRWRGLARSTAQLLFTGAAYNEYVL